MVTDGADVSPSRLVSVLCTMVAGGAAAPDVTSAAVTMSLGPGVTVHAEVTTTGGGADEALANVLDAAAAATQPRNKWAAIEEQEAVEVQHKNVYFFACWHMQMRNSKRAPVL